MHMQSAMNTKAINAHFNHSDLETLMPPYKNDVINMITEVVSILKVNLMILGELSIILHQCVFYS